MVLTELPRGDGIGVGQQTVFGGLNHTPGATDGEFYTLRNLGSELYPLLSSRRARALWKTLTRANGLYAKEALAWVDGTNFYYDGELVGQVRDGPKTFASLGNFLLIFPDKKYFLTNWETGNLYQRFGELEASYGGSGAGISFHDGEYAGAVAAANTISTSGGVFPFRQGDAVAISGCQTQPDNNKTAVIQEISADGKSLRFYANTFVVQGDAYQQVTLEQPLEATARAAFLVGNTYRFDQGWFSVNQQTKIEISATGAALAVNKYYVEQSQTTGTTEGRLVYRISAARYVAQGRLQEQDQGYLSLTLVKIFAARSYHESGSLTLKRAVPDLDWCCENENRLWGVKGKEIFACKLGDPFNWNVFAGLSTDSYNAPTGTDGDFSAAVSYLGYPVFFKPNAIHKVYGSKPGNFQVIHSANLGVALDSGRSPAVVGNTLYYLSPSGVVAYQGGVPTLIDSPLGERFHEGIGGTDGKAYYLSMKDERAQRRLFVYDPSRNLWHEEDDPGVRAMVNLGPELYFLIGNQLWQARGPGYADVEWQAETADYTDRHYGKKYAGPYLTLRCDLAIDAQMTVEISYDDGEWELLGRFSGQGTKRSLRLAAVPARCDHYRLRLSGRGEMRLYSLAWERAAGSGV